MFDTVLLLKKIFIIYKNCHDEDLEIYLTKGKLQISTFFNWFWGTTDIREIVRF